MGVRGIVQGVQIRGERDCTGCADKGGEGLYRVCR